MLTIKWHILKTGPSEKVDFRKSGPQAYTKTRSDDKIHFVGQKNLYDKSEVADFKYDNKFLT